MVSVLMFNYYYLPDISGGSERPRNFLKYLNQFGYNIHLVTTSYDQIDYSDDNDSIIRIKDYRKNDSPLVITVAIRLLQKAKRAMGMPIRSDDYWASNVIRHLPELIERYHPDVCIVSFPPPCALDIGRCLKEKYPQIKLISDFRDGFLYFPMYPEMKDDSIRLNRAFMQRYRKLERDIAACSDAVITISDALKEYFEGVYGRDIVYKITNGYNHEEVIEANPIELPEDKLVLLYTGGLRSSRQGYFEYFKRFIDSGLLESLDVYIVMIGEYRDYEKKYFALNDRIIALQAMPRDVIIATQKKADILLNVTGEDALGALNGKLFEYIFAKKPILSIGKHEMVERLLEDTNAGNSYSLEQMDQIKQFIIDVKEGKSKFAFRNLDKYTREYGARKLAEVIESVTRGGNYVDNKNALWN